MSTAMRAYLVVASATVIVPWLLCELTEALGWGVPAERKSR